MTATDDKTRLYHAYFAINFNIVWDTVTVDVEPLIKQLEKAIAEEE